jgi:hypothetical protein
MTPFLLRPDVKSVFHWISHTFTHENLDNVSASQARDELNQNTSSAQNQLGLPGYEVSELVTPDVSGLGNPNFLTAAYDLGVRYVVSDTSLAGYNNPTPNTGIANPLQPGILMIPRHPNNLFFNVATPADWTAEYNCIYRSYWQRDLSYEEIANIESDRLLTYLLKGDADPWMFHQTNLDAYDGTRTLLTDLLSATLAKYQALYTLPIASPKMWQIGGRMIERADYDASGVAATLDPRGVVIVRVTRPAVIPITGLLIPWSEYYGGQPITRMWMTPEYSMTLEDFAHDH